MISIRSSPSSGSKFMILNCSHNKITSFEMSININNINCIDISNNSLSKKPHALSKYNENTPIKLIDDNNPYKVSKSPNNSNNKSNTTKNPKETTDVSGGPHINNTDKKSTVTHIVPQKALNPNNAVTHIGGLITNKKKSKK